LPGYSTFYPKNFKPVLNYLLASLLYHWQFLDKRLDQSHPLRHQRVWNSPTIARVKPLVLAGRFVNEVSGLEASGVPPHIVIANQLIKVETRLKLVEEELLTRITQLPQELKRTILDNFVVDGAVPLTRSDVELIVSNIMEESNAKLLAAVQTIANSGRSGGTGDAQSMSTTQAVQNEQWDGENDRHTYALFSWRGRHHPVPEGYDFPRQKLYSYVYCYIL